ncbi:alpha/beta fold hydrolase [Chitinophagaceae bacterium MMS25-I14]
MRHLIILHGALGSSAQFGKLAEKLSHQYQLHLLNFSGHGGRDLPGEQFSIDLFAKDVLAYIEEQKLDKVSIFGYSMGGYVALFLAKNNPEKIDKIVTLASKLHWDEATAARELKLVDPAVIMEKVPSFATELQKRHAPVDWQEMLQRTGQMLTMLGKHNTLSLQDYKSIGIPVLMLIGDNDRMVSLEETIEVFKTIPGAQMGMLPGTKHPIEQTNIDLLVCFIQQFLS